MISLQFTGELLDLSDYVKEDGERPALMLVFVADGGAGVDEDYEPHILIYSKIYLEKKHEALVPHRRYKVSCNDIAVTYSPSPFGIESVLTFVIDEIERVTS